MEKSSHGLTSAGEAKEGRRKRKFQSVISINKKRSQAARKVHEKKGFQKRGIWTLAETLKYIAYIKLNAEKFDTEDSRRDARVFVIMSQLIKTRKSIQCRSHHQKMMKYHGSILRIVQHYENDVIPRYQRKIVEKADRLKTRKELLQAHLRAVDVQRKPGNVVRIVLFASQVESY